MSYSVHEEDIKKHEYQEAGITGVLVKAGYHTHILLSYSLSLSDCVTADFAYLENMIYIYWGLNREPVSGKHQASEHKVAVSEIVGPDSESE